jgi:superoxide dismutase, Fe-Mn family
MQEKIARRTGGAGLIAGSAITATLPPLSALAQTPSNAGPKPMTYDIKPIPFDPKNIKGSIRKTVGQPLRE